MEHGHDPEAIRRRLSVRPEQSYLRDWLARQAGPGDGFFDWLAPCSRGEPSHDIRTAIPETTPRSQACWDYSPPHWDDPVGLTPLTSPH